MRTPLDLLLVFAASVFALGGCKSSAHSDAPAAAGSPHAIDYPPRPTIAPPALKVFHQSDNTITLVTKPDATDDEIAAALWELRDAAAAHGFDALGIPQKVVDARKPILWFHVYRGVKCASEKYADKLPCGASYHAAGEFTLGSYTNPNWNDGELRRHDDRSDQEAQLWNPDGNPNAPAAGGSKR